MITKPKNILVLGGSGELGKTIISDLHKFSATITATYNRRPSTLTLNDVNWVKWKISDQLTSDLQKFGPWDGIACCLGGAPGSDLEHSLEDLCNLVINIKEKHLLAKNSNVVFLSSFINQKMVDTNLNFAIEQGGLRTATRVLAKKIGSHNILVNSIELGIFEAQNSNRISEEQKRLYLENCALSRFGKWNEAAFIFNWFLLYNTYITGQNILADGGL